MKAVSGAAFERRQIQRPERLVPGQDEIEQQRRGDARHRHRRQHVDDLLPMVAPSMRAASRMSFGISLK